MSQSNEPSVLIPPPPDLSDYGPSALMTYFIQAGGWTNLAFADEISARHPTNTVRVETVADWANKNVRPTRYGVQLYRVIDDCTAPELALRWRIAFQTVWAEHRARPKKRQPSNDDQPPAAGND